MVLSLLPSVTLAREGRVPKPEPSADTDTWNEFWWFGDPVPRGMITLAPVFSNYSDSPSARGVRIGYGAMGTGDDFYGHVETWFSYQETGDTNIASTGLSVGPMFLYRRFALGIPIDVGFERRSDGDRHVLAGIIGTGAELNLRLFRRWDLLVTVEQAYRTTVESELQGCIGIRFHHERIPFWRR